jgi:hypothetical protein
MRKFSDLKLPGSQGGKMFDCKTVSITEIVNCEIHVLDFVAGLKTLHGEGRVLIKISLDGQEAKFFTNCSAIKNTMLSLEENDLPFATTIRKIKTGSAASYKFT